MRAFAGRIGFGALLMPLDAQAGVLSCSFTEPFFNISFDSATGVVTWISADETDPDTGKPIPKILAKSAKLEILDYRCDRPETAPH